MLQLVHHIPWTWESIASHVTEAAVNAQMSMITTVFSVQTDSYKIELLKIRILRDAFKHAHQEHFRRIIFVRNAINLAKNAVAAMIIIVLSVQMDCCKTQLIY